MFFPEKDIMLLAVATCLNKRAFKPGFRGTHKNHLGFSPAPKPPPCLCPVSRELPPQQHQISAITQFCSGSDTVTQHRRISEMSSSRGRAQPWHSAAAELSLSAAAFPSLVYSRRIWNFLLRCSSRVKRSERVLEKATESHSCGWVWYYVFATDRYDYKNQFRLKIASEVLDRITVCGSCGKARTWWASATRSVAPFPTLGRQLQ